MAAHHVPVRLLELEATESAIMIDPQRPHQIPEKFSAPEVRIFLVDILLAVNGQDSNCYAT